VRTGVKDASAQLMRIISKSETTYTRRTIDDEELIFYTKSALSSNTALTTSQDRRLSNREVLLSALESEKGAQPPSSQCQTRTTKKSELLHSTWITTKVVQYETLLYAAGY
jgi:hypothetical protein